MSVSKKERLSVSVRDSASYVVGYALMHGLIGHRDRTWAYNRILDHCGIAGLEPEEHLLLPANYDILDALKTLCEKAAENGRANTDEHGFASFSTRVLAELMPRPSEIARVFAWLRSKRGPEAATDWLYGLACHSLYIQPQKVPMSQPASRESAHMSDYPSCPYCMENEGYVAPEDDSQLSLRFAPVELEGESWALAYISQPAWEEHCRVVRSQHGYKALTLIELATNLLSFTEHFPHYFCAYTGSIYTNPQPDTALKSMQQHLYFEAGKAKLPLLAAPARAQISLPTGMEAEAHELEWPGDVVRISASSKEELLAALEHLATSQGNMSAQEDMTDTDICAVAWKDETKNVFFFAWSKKNTFELAVNKASKTSSSLAAFLGCA